MSSKSFCLVLILSFAMTGCSRLYRVPPGGDQPQLTQMGLSTATGAAIGAGLGTLFGSISGNAGQGLVLGSLAGAATGAAVGYQLEQEGSNQAARSASITREQEFIEQEQNKILQEQDLELREMESDLGAELIGRNRPSVVPSNYSPETYVGNPNARSWSQPKTAHKRARLAMAPAAKPVKLTEPRKPKKAKPSVAYKQAPKPKILSQKVATSSIKAELPSLSMAEEQTPSSQELAAMPKKEVLKAEMPKKEMIGAVGFEKPEKIVAARIGAPEPSKVIEKAGKTEIERARPLMVRPDDPNCIFEESEKEAARAADASSKADKLFYLRRALRLCPGAAHYHLEIGRVYASIGRVEDAEFEFRRAVDLDPKSEQAQKELRLIGSVQ